MKNVDIKVAIRCDQHANEDSLPLRYGIYFNPPGPFKRKIITLFDLGEIINDREFINRKHVIASFYDDDFNIHRGHFVLAQNDNPEEDFLGFNGGSYPCVVTVWRPELGYSADKETQLSATLTDMRKKGQVTKDELVKMHPLYLENKIWNYGDLINALAILRAEQKSIDDLINLDEKTLDNIAQEDAENLAQEAYLEPQNGQKINEAPPMTLLKVEELWITSRAGLAKKTICLHFKESQEVRKNNWPRGYDARLKLCNELVGKLVVTDSWGNFNPNAWFQNIQETQPYSIAI